MSSYIPKEAALALLANIPAIPAHRRRELSELYARLGDLLNRPPHSRLLSVLKYAAYITLLLNAGSLPFVWHVRVFWPLILYRLEYCLLCLRLAFAFGKDRARARIAWAEKLSPVGANPFEVSMASSRWAGIDDIDLFGLHLSNSSYAKALDAPRAEALIQWFPAWGRSGGQMALGATHYHFLREILPFARYEIRLTIGSWDHKWLYLVARYVTRPRRRPACRASDSASASPSQPSTSSTPPGLPDDTVPNGSGPVDVEHAVAALLHHHTDRATKSQRRAPITEPDGALLHCVAVSQICFKAAGRCSGGRITIPPAVVLAAEGFTRPLGERVSAAVDADDDVGILIGHRNGIITNASANANGRVHVNGDARAQKANAGAGAYSHAHPPPNWVVSQSLRVPPQGSMEGFRAFLRGGWRDAPAEGDGEGVRWWEDALAGSVEAKRRANLEILDGLKRGLELTRTLR